MTHIDAVRQPGTIMLDGQSLDWADELAARTGIAPAAVVRYLLADAIAKTAPLVDAGALPPGSPDEVTGQGTTRPPAPTNARVLVRVADVTSRGDLTCTVSRKRCDTPAPWLLTNPSEWEIGHPYIGAACCDDHIPDGWVRPDEVIATTLPPACDTCGERSEHEVCS